MRTWLTILLVLICSTLEAANKQYVGKVKSRGGSIIGNIVVSAKNPTEATAKILKRYKGGTLLSLDEK